MVMTNDLKFYLSIIFRKDGLTRGLRDSRGDVSRFGTAVRNEFNAARNAVDSLAGRILGVGAAATAASQVVASAQLSRQIRQIELTAGASQEMGAEFRSELHAMARETGQSIPSLIAGFNNLVQAGLSWSEALATVKAINPAMAVTGADANALAASLTVAAEAFDFDLSKLSEAELILDRMTVAGRLGNAELEDLSSIFARVGMNAKSANLGFSDTLALIENMSLTERNPERLATLVDSTLRLFTNQNYLKSAASATQVKFYDEKGDRRAALDVLGDIAEKYKRLSTSLEKDRALQAAFGNTDLDTQKGIKALLESGALENIRKMRGEIEAAGGRIRSDLKNALDNSVDQVQRLRAALKEAADGFSKPIDTTINRIIQYALNKKEDGGLGLTGGEIVGGAAGLAVAGYAVTRVAGSVVRSLGKTAGGVAVGKALEETAGIQPVYVVNMPDGGMGSSSDISGKVTTSAGSKAKTPKVRRLSTLQLLRKAPDLATIAALGPGAIMTAGAAVAGAGAAGYALGTLVNRMFLEGTDFSDGLGRGIAKIGSAFGSTGARDALASEAAGAEATTRAAERMERAAERMEHAEASVSVHMTGDAKTRITDIKGSGVGLEVDRGLIFSDV